MATVPMTRATRGIGLDRARQRTEGAGGFTPATAGRSRHAGGQGLPR